MTFGFCFIVHSYVVPHRANSAINIIHNHLFWAVSSSIKKIEAAIAHLITVKSPTMLITMKINATRLPSSYQLYDISTQVAVYSVK